MTTSPWYVRGVASFDATIYAPYIISLLYYCAQHIPQLGNHRIAYLLHSLIPDAGIATVHHPNCGSLTRISTNLEPSWPNSMIHYFIVNQYDLPPKPRWRVALLSIRMPRKRELKTRQLNRQKWRPHKVNPTLTCYQRTDPPNYISLLF